MKVLMKCLFGSKLYGTSTETSDTDYKGVHLPSKKDLFLTRAKNSIVNNSKISETLRNSKDDVDFESYSLQYFLLTLGKNGDTTFLDMVHAPDSCLLETSPEWEYLRKNRAKFYTKSLKSYLGYCRSQAARFGVKGTKLEEAETLLKLLDSKSDDMKLSSFWEELPVSSQTKKYELASCQSTDKRVYDFYGKKLMATTNVFYTKQVIKTFYDSFGARAAQAKLNQGVDWKGVHHGLRVALQLKELYTTGDLVFPLKDASWLRDVKQGKLHYVNDNVGELLNNLVTEVEELASRSTFNEEVDLTEWEDFVVNCY